MTTIFHGDCVQLMSSMDAESVDLCFADPPYNIGFRYDFYEDSKSPTEYVDWCKQWMTQVRRVLTPTGTFWLAIGDDYAAELKIAAQHVGFHFRQWCIWHYTFGVNCQRKFTRSHTHLLHFTKHKKKFCFNADDPELRVASARQLKYKDKRANANGRLPDDVWQIPRVCGTHKERAGFHGCQMPEQLLTRIVRASSNPGDLVLDPFAGSGSTLRVALQLGRRAIGFELSEEYARQAEKRLLERRA